MRMLARLWLWLFLVVALLAPLLANDVPIVAWLDGELRMPAFRSYTGSASILPDPGSSTTWKERWAKLPTEGGADWMVMPPWPFGPMMDGVPRNRNHPPTAGHPLGTDDVGKDVLMRVIWGSHTALRIGAGAVLLALLLGVSLGALAGYLGGATDRVVSVLIEVFLCFPVLFLVLIVAAFAGDSAWAVIGVLGIVFWTSFARLVRGELLSLRGREFVLAARGLGLSPGRVLWRHLLPQVRGPILVNVGFVFAGAIIAESALAFFGIGPGASGRSESWGRILAFSKEPFLRGAWHLWLFPAAALVLTIWCVHARAQQFESRER